VLKEGTERERQAGVVGGAPVEKVGLVVRLREQGSDTEGVLSAGGWLERAAQWQSPGGTVPCGARHCGRWRCRSGGLAFSVPSTEEGGWMNKGHDKGGGKPPDPQAKGNVVVTGMCASISPPRATNLAMITESGLRDGRFV
jgi:hypothetical protein